MPALRRLRLLHITRSMPQEEQEEVEACAPSPTALQHWLDVANPFSYSRRMLENSPELESITVALASTAWPSQESLDWIYLTPPCPVPWEVERLLLMAMHKPHGSCPMSILTPNLADNILNFLGSMSWQRSIRELPPAETARFGLSQDFSKCALEG